MLLNCGVGEDSLKSPLDCKEIQPVHPNGDQSCVFIGRTDAEAETPILWPPDGKSWLIGKDPDAGRDWGQEEKGTTEDEMAGWHHPTRWTWVCVNSGSWWWTGRPGMLRFMGSQRFMGSHDWATELNYIWDSWRVGITNFRASYWIAWGFSRLKTKFHFLICPSLSLHKCWLLINILTLLRAYMSPGNIHTSYLKCHCIWR